ncbi:MAG: SHOCT domain-containing protein [Candidatus Marinimicrobia bacterium]|nr:SHOCT domain-containing protein [Candidatus Neomarinimicrobiota bacterium]MCF7830366.1 SHOCT domain-containing protein [Candidatus Neomarinimicrobiota bacterium]MCF7882164.1 SHOCT domain-containing protein [Candidatus Neomarinimicrobiota bacterium]
MMGFGGIIWLAVIGGGIWIASQITNGQTLKNTSSGSNFIQDTPLDILKKRYAKGEISKKEYQEMQENL